MPSSLPGRDRHTLLFFHPSSPHGPCQIAAIRTTVFSCSLCQLAPCTTLVMKTRPLWGPSLSSAMQIHYGHLGGPTTEEAKGKFQKPTLATLHTAGRHLVLFDSKQLLHWSRKSHSLHFLKACYRHVDERSLPTIINWRAWAIMCPTTWKCVLGLSYISGGQVLFWIKLFCILPKKARVSQRNKHIKKQTMQLAILSKLDLKPHTNSLCWGPNKHISIQNQRFKCHKASGRNQRCSRSPSLTPSVNWKAHEVRRTQQLRLLSTRAERCPMFVSSGSFASSCFHGDKIISIVEISRWSLYRHRSLEKQNQWEIPCVEVIRNWLIEGQAGDEIGKCETCGTSKQAMNSHRSWCYSPRAEFLQSTQVFVLKAFI